MHPYPRFRYHSAAYCFLQLGEDVRDREMRKKNDRKACALVMVCKMLLCTAVYGARFPKMFRLLKPEVARIFLRTTLLLSCNWYYS